MLRLSPNVHKKKAKNTTEYMLYPHPQTLHPALLVIVNLIEGIHMLLEI